MRRSVVQPPVPRTVDWIMVAGLGLIWGSTFLGIELALRGVTPFWLTAFRIGFAALLMGAVQLYRGRRLMLEAGAKIPWHALAWAGALSSAVPFMLISWSQQFVSSGFVGVSMAAVALMVLPTAHFLIPGEQMSWRKSLAFVIGFLGVALLIGGQAFESTGSSLQLAGRLAALSAAACYAVSSVMLRRLAAMDPIMLAGALLYIGALIVLPVAWIVEGPPPLPPPDTLAVLALLALLPTAGANLLRVLVIRAAGPSFMSLTNYQVPLWSVFLGAVLLGEPLPSTMLVAMALILCGVALSQYQALRQLRARK